MIFNMVLLKGCILGKPPNDANASAVGGFHYSGPRKKRNRNRRARGQKASANSDVHSQSEFDPLNIQQVEGDIVGRGNNSASREKTANADNITSIVKNESKSTLPSNPPDHRSKDRSRKSAQKRHQGEGARTAASEKRADIGDVVGCGFDAKAGYKNKKYHNSSSNNTRPGRRQVAKDSEIEFPPKPNRQNRGIESKPAARNKIGKLAGKSQHNGLQGIRIDSRQHGNQPEWRSRKPDRKLANWTQTNDLGPLYAALDLGTNNCRLLVALPQQAGRFRVVDAFSRIVRLGQDLESSGRLDEKAMARAVEALGECARKLRNAKISKMRLIATEACRRAQNGEEFLVRVKRETGLDLEIVNRETEAHLAAEGCGALVDKKADGAVLFDIGGGSSELILLDRRGRRNKKIYEQISSWTSLPVGVVTLSERHGGRDVSRQMFNSMVEEVEGHLQQFEGRSNLSDLWSKGRVHLLGTSGTVTTLAGVHLKLPRYDRRQVDGIWLSDEQVDGAIEQLMAMDYHQRAANACIGVERADLVLAGCAILQAIRNHWPAPRLRVADRGLREGILTQLMNQDGAWIAPKRGRRKYRARANQHTK